MRSLFIDTSSFFMTIAIVENNKILYNFKEKIQNDMSSRIISEIENAFNSVSFEIKDINKIFVVNGPGSFTGVRVGVTAAKVIAWALNIDVIPISSLEFIATTKTEKKLIAPLIDAKRGNVFAAVYDDELGIVEREKLINLDLFLEGKNNDIVFISNDNIENTIKPNTDIMKIINKHINDEPIDSHSLKPNYLKLTEAEESMNDKRNN